MAENLDLKNELMALVSSGRYEIVQQINDEAEEPYEGCEHNLMMILDGQGTTVKLLDTADPQARKDCKTYKVTFKTYMGRCAVVIWEV